MKQWRAAAAALAVSTVLWIAPASAQSGESMETPARGHRDRPIIQQGYEGFVEGRNRRRDRHDEPRRRQGYGYGFAPWVGYADDDYRPFEYRDSGFFSGAGAATPTADGGVHYDYDRSYPYDHYRGEGAAATWESPPRALHCRVEWPRDSRGGRVPVRICSQ